MCAPAILSLAVENYEVHCTSSGTMFIHKFGEISGSKAEIDTHVCAFYEACLN
jgi:hypothetical protein